MKNDMAEFFDKLAPEWDNAPSKYGIREKIVAMMDLSPGSIIADIGCGKGVMFGHLLKINPLKIIAVDISGKMIQAAKELYNDNRIEYINDDFFNISFPVMLDAVIFFNSYPHILDKSVLAEKAAQIIKKSGTMIIAHSTNKTEINGIHKGGVSKLSAPLENAAVEAGKFRKFFSPDILIDDDEMYFIKMSKR